jgi:hypothetical protein
MAQVNGLEIVGLLKHIGVQLIHQLVTAYRE